ncbi:MAG TPA: ATP-binding cassette domain-containing protein [Gemmatimonadaceae bacterium]|nr:ATP-binding cassette domain-containing protein [Gemmatimonadaceae bacterium]
MDVHRRADGPLTDPPALELHGIHVRFGDVHALRGATFAARERSVHALLGENGAGKTTLMRVAFGLLRPESGVMRLHGTELRPGSPADAIEAGIGMVHQHFTLVRAMTVAENVALGAHESGQSWRFDAERACARVREIGAATGLHLPPDALVSTLAVGAQQRLEIVKALERDARVLILDEPTAVLSPAESDELLRRLRRLADEGRTVVLITHKLREALAVADEITVLRHGRTVLRAPAGDLDGQSLAAAMLGTPPETAGRAAAAAAHRGPVVISARNLGLRDQHGTWRIRSATFDVRAGEIVGVAAVEGSGHRDLLRALAGRRVANDGTISLPPDVGFVPEDRQHDALALELSLTENVALRGAGRRRGIVAWDMVARHTRDLLDAFDVRARDELITARALSGGNQQKLVLARELDGAPAALVAENPTRGLDIRAADSVRDRLLAARDAGTAVVLYSSDIDEALALAGRMLVVFDGTVREVPHDRAAIGAAMIGVG